jgi:hypothetical protein
MKRFKAFVLPHWLRRSQIRHWLILFLFVNLAFELTGGPNPNSRLATVYAMIEDQSFRIDPYRFWTTDWAKTPDGHYYSNKAPGPAFLAVLPVAIMDAAVVGWNKERPVRDLQRFERKHPILRVASFLLQALPYAYLCAYFIHWLTLHGTVGFLLQWIAVALLFGNTAAVLMNSFFGHAIAANFIFAAMLSILLKRPGWFGLTMGWAVLSDYGSIFVLPFFLLASVALRRDKSFLRHLLKVGGGAVFPFVLWCWYHTSSFGHFWTLPQKFQNPIFLDLKEHEYAFWGILSWLPNPNTLLELLFGFSRGLLFTQPWILILLFLFPAFFAKLTKEQRIMGGAIYLGFFSLLTLNASFGQWHGGFTFGPRYLSILFPCFAYLLALDFPKVKYAGKLATRIGIVAAMILSSAIFLTNTTPPPDNALWAVYANRIFTDPQGTVLLRGIFFLPALAFVLRRSIQVSNK